MIRRALFDIAFSEDWGRQMRFVTGPRQSGKTTLAQLKLKQERSEKLYFLWDLRSVRNRYKTNQLFFTEDQPPGPKKLWVCFDEMHKIPKWKNALKAIFDSTFENYRFMVTGSAKFELFKKAGDSLSGRYFTFRLLPLSLSEVLGSPSLPASPPPTAQEWIQQKLDPKGGASAEKAMDLLLQYGGFPEPFVRQSEAFHAKWAEDYLDTVIQEDIGALTRIIDREHLYDVYRLLPEMVASPLSASSLASHLELTPPTLKNYLKRLEDFYLVFRVPPYFKNIKRSLLKAPKGYLYDWTRIKHLGKRFENYIAVELLSRLSLWQDASGEKYALFYIRTKQKEETDFLILKNQEPWLLIETKLSDEAIESHHSRIQSQLRGIPFVQLCRETGVCRKEAKNTYRVSASRFLS